MKGIFKGKKGFTLVELIVTFALTMIFTAACAMTVSSYLKVYTKINDMTLCKTLADTLEETIQGSLGAATSNIVDGEGETLRSVIISDGGAKVTYRNKDGYPMEIYCEEGRLVLHFLEVKVGGLVTSQEVEWIYQDGVYAGNELQTIAFDHAGGNIISAELTLVNPVTNNYYVTKHAIECYNLGENEITEE